MPTGRQGTYSDRCKHLSSLQEVHSTSCRMLTVFREVPNGNPRVQTPSLQRRYSGSHVSGTSLNADSSPQQDKCTSSKGETSTRHRRTPHRRRTWADHRSGWRTRGIRLWPVYAHTHYARTRSSPSRRAGERNGDIRAVDAITVVIVALADVMVERHVVHVVVNDHEHVGQLVGRLDARQPRRSAFGECGDHSRRLASRSGIFLRTNGPAPSRLTISVTPYAPSASTRSTQ